MHYLFSDYALDTQRAELHRAGAPIKLRRKAFQVLAYLLMHRDRVVPKHELLEYLWPDQFVGDGVLKACITALRKALGEQGRAARFIRTLHGQGYRFVATVEEREHLPGDPEQHDLLLHGEEGTTSQAEMSSPAFTPLHANLGSPPVEALVGEYKQVTALCGALAEAPTLAAQLGPEAMYRLMREVLALAQETVQRYDGTLLYISSEGFLALFGAPVAQEDHARRAVLTALDLRQRVRTAGALREQPFSIALRLGLHSGPVVVGALADALQRPYAAGATLHVATQLQLQAASDTLLVSATTYALVQDEVQGEACESSTCKALSSSVPVYAIHGVKQRRSGVPNRGARLLSRFVGRTQELTLLHTRLVQAVSGQGQVIGIAGEPGLGKSRLLSEFTHRLDGQTVTYCEGHCLTYGSATPYLPVRDLLRKLWDLSDSITAPSITATVQQRLDEAGVASEAEKLLLLQLLDVPVDLATVAALSPQERKTRTFALLRHLFWHASQRQPLVLALENLHWIDPTSEEWLTSLVERLEDTSVLLLATYRSGYQPPWLRHSVATQMALPRLSPRDSLAMLQSVPQGAQLPVPQQQAIVAKAAGSPFFVEELTWAVVVHGDYTLSLPLPDTIEAVLAARLDRLPPEEKHLVQVAAVIAVIGTEVPVPLLQWIVRLSEEALQRGLLHLQSLEFLYEAPLFPEHAYTFKHALTQEVAYAGLLQEQRCTLHACIVEAIERLYANRLPEQIEQLAHHAFRGQVWDKAVVYCRQAGTKAHDRAAFGEAKNCFGQALAALAHVPESPTRAALTIDLHLDLAWASEQLGEYEQSLVLIGEIEALARTLDDWARLCQVLIHKTHLIRTTADHPGAIATGQQALAIATQLGDRAMQMAATHRLAQLCFSIGDYGQAATLLRQNVAALEAGAPDPRREYGIQSRAWLALVLGFLGEFAKGRPYGEEAFRLSTVEGRRDTPGGSYGCLGLLSLTKGDLEHAIRVLDQGLALCRATGNKGWFRAIEAGLGYAYALTGRITEGLVLLEDALKEDIRTGARQGHSMRVTWLSEAYLLAGRYDKAWQHARQALDLAQQYRERGYEALALHQLGAVCAHADSPDVEPAAHHYRQALTLAEELGMRPLQAHCNRGLGTLYTKTGQREQARAALDTAITLYRSMDMTFWLPQAEAMLAVVHCNASCS